MELSFDLQEEDLRLAQRVATKSLQKASGHWTIAVLGVVHWMCAGAFTMCVLDLVRSDARTVVLVLGFAMIASLWLVWLCQARRMHAWQRVQMGPYPQRQHLVADDMGLTLESVRGTIRLAWSEVRDLQSGPDHVFLLFDNGGCFPIPGRAFDTAETRAGFVSTVNAFRAAATAA